MMSDWYDIVTNTSMKRPNNPGSSSGFVFLYIQLKRGVYIWLPVFLCFHVLCLDIRLLYIRCIRYLAKYLPYR